MGDYYFLMVVGLIWVAFACVQDIRKREVSNWLNFSLVAFALSYRAFYSLFFNDYNFFYFGILGFGLFFCLAYLFYYSKAFAGGDAKLLMGIGAILPFESYFDLFSVSILFIFSLFLIGAAYSLFYSLFIAIWNKEVFVKEFNLKIVKWRYYLLILFIISFVLWIYLRGVEGSLIFFILFVIPVLYVYLKALEKCMIKRYSPWKLSEGDWLERDVKVHGKWIRKSVHGLSYGDIKLLRKYNKQVLIKEGIPFVPAFLLASIFIALVFILKMDYINWMLSLF